METKQCRTCKKDLELSLFRKSGRTKDWFTLDCAECYDKADRTHSHRYWKYKTGKKLDNGRRMKKRGRKTWTLMVQKTDVEIEIGTIVNYLSFWKNKITHEDNIKEWLKPNVPMNINQAAKEFGIHPNTFYQHLRNFPALKNKYEMLRQNMREYLKDTAESNMQKILVNGDLTDKEKFDASFKVAQATMKEYNPKVEIEKKEIKVNLNKNSDDLKMDLANILWVNI